MKEQETVTAMNVDLVLVNPGAMKKNYQFLEKTEAAIEPPVWLGLIATFVRNHGYSVTVLDENAEGRSPEETADIVSAIDPVLVGVVVYGQNPSASTQNMGAAGEICRRIKELSETFRVILVGGHVAALPERTLVEEKADYVCGGEGPLTVLSLLSELKKGKKADISKVPGLYFRVNDGIESTPPAPLVADLDDTMAGVAWDLLPMNRYRAHTWHCYGGYPRTPYAALYTSLGCPFQCRFCCIQAPFRQGEKARKNSKNANSYRMWSVPSVIRQIDTLVRDYGVTSIKFADEMFFFNRKHVEGICRALIERDYGLNIWAYARVDTVNSSLLGLMRQAGFRWLCFGIEAADNHVRDAVNKGTRKEHIVETLNTVRDAGIHIGANYIFGLPDDDMESMERTLELAVDINAEFSNFYCAMAYPGSDLYREALENKWPLPADWSGYSQLSMDTLPLPTKHVTSAEVLRFRDRAFQRFTLGPRHLAMIERTFGRDVVETLRESAAKPLIRKYDQPINPRI
jgi:radical SAM superfamily enzyme YgiQ (UPF0313 family)